MTMATSSTPIAAAAARTCSTARARMSMPRIGAIGVLPSSTTTVSVIPGRSSDRSGSPATGCARATATAPAGSGSPGSDSGG